MALLDSAQYYSMRDPVRTSAIAHQVLDLVSEEDNIRYTIRALIYCAHSEVMLSNRAVALEYCNRAIPLASEIGDVGLQIEIHYMIGSVFLTQEIRDSSLLSFQNVITLSPKDSSTYFLCTAYTNVGWEYWHIGNHVKAEEYLLKGLSCSAGNEKLKPFTLVPLIEYYSITDDPKYFVYVDTLAHSDFYLKASSLSATNHYDIFLFVENQPEEAKEQRMREICKYFLDRGSVREYVQFGLSLTAQLHQAGKYYAERSLLDSLMEKASGLESGRYMAHVLKALYKNSIKSDRFQDAIDYNERYLKIYERVITEENRNAINELNIQFETTQKDFQISQQNTRLEQERKNRIFLIVLLGLAGALCVVIVFYLRYRILLARRLADQRKLLHTQEIAHIMKEKEFAGLTASLEAREKERNRIARDLHDEIGSALSSIQVYSSAAQKAMEATPEVAREIIQRITASSRQLMEDVSDIVWAINTGAGKMSLEDKLRNYGYELLAPQGILCTYAIDPGLERRLMDMEARKNVLMIAKEAMNNIAKYSAATAATVRVEAQNGSLELTISDNGNGFDTSARRKGHGQSNMQLRTETMGGEFRLVSAVMSGTTVYCKIPLTTISDRQTVNTV